MSDATLLVAIDAAIAELVAGKRKVMLTFGDKSIQYGQTNLTDLRALRDETAADIAIAAETSTPSKYVLARFRKGL